MSQAKKTQIQRIEKRNKWILLAAISSAAIILAAVIVFIKSGTDSNAEIAVIKDQDLIIPISEISDTARFYPVEIDKTTLEVIAVKASDGSIRTAFNTCQVCYDSGRGYYKQESSVLVCQNCGNRFKMDQVEVQSGGCNPVPIFPENKTVTDESITIPYDYLKEAKGIFANWKSTY